MFFKRSSRRNSNTSYIDHEANPRSQSLDYDADRRPDSSRKESHQQPTSPTEDPDMYPRQQQPQEQQSLPVRGLSNSGMPPAMNHRAPAMGNSQPEPMPDLLAIAFQQAVRPYSEKIEALESQLGDLQSWVDQLESQYESLAF
jgi:hypothetical protein